MSKDISPIVSADSLTTSYVLDLFSSPNTDFSKLAFSTAAPEVIAAKIAARDLNAASLEELLGGSETISGRDYVQKPFCITGIEWQVSDIKGEGLPFYVVMHAANIDGEAITITTGARSVMRKVAVMEQKGWFPAWVKITKGEKTESGGEPLDLVAAPQGN
jgi:hypothetical protein